MDRLQHHRRIGRADRLATLQWQSDDRPDLAGLEPRHFLALLADELHEPAHAKLAPRARRQHGHALLERAAIHADERQLTVLVEHDLERQPDELALVTASIHR